MTRSAMRRCAPGAPVGAVLEPRLVLREIPLVFTGYKSRFENRSNGRDFSECQSRFENRSNGGALPIDQETTHERP